MTGLEWAVLQAFARTLPMGEVRVMVREMALSGRPARQGVALVTASGLGLLRNGYLTPAGEQAARAYLRRVGRLPEVGADST